MDEIEQWVEELRAGLDEESDFTDADAIDEQWRDTVRAVEMGIL